MEALNRIDVEASCHIEQSARRFQIDMRRMGWAIGMAVKEADNRMFAAFAQDALFEFGIRERVNFEAVASLLGPIGQPDRLVNDDRRADLLADQCATAFARI